MAETGSGRVASVVVGVVVMVDTSIIEAIFPAQVCSISKFHLFFHVILRVEVIFFSYSLNSVLFLIPFLLFILLHS